MPMKSTSDTPYASCLVAVGFLCVCSSATADPSGVQRATYAAESHDPTTGGTRDERLPPARAPRRLPAGNAKSLPLPPRGVVRTVDGAEEKAAKPIKLNSTLTTGVASLAVVLGLFFAAAWAVRRGLPQGPPKLPAEVVEVLGRAPLAGRQFAHLVRCGNKLLLVHLAPNCAETLTEITEPAEVDRLAGLCRQAHPQSATASFRQIFQQVSRENPTDAEPST